jgi:SEC-C motif-containing protein
MKQKPSISGCPCGSGHAPSQCCEPYINGTSVPPTAETLMRSRYTAYSQLNDAYLLKTWHSSTRPDSLDLDASMQWLGLEILNSGYDWVEFIATYKIQGKAHRLHENSRFVYENQRWFYLDAQK